MNTFDLFQPTSATPEREPFFEDAACAGDESPSLLVVLSTKEEPPFILCFLTCKTMNKDDDPFASMFDETGPLLWKLPDAVLFQIICFVAPPTHRAAVVCHQIAVLSRDATRTLLKEETATSLWDIILREDYGVHEHADGSRGTSSSRRMCKRLRRSLLQRVKGAHRKYIRASSRLESAPKRQPFRPRNRVS